MPLNNNKEGWGEPIATFDWSTNVTTIPFTNLGGYREIKIWIDDFKTDTGGSDAPVVQLSSDNGSSYIATGYDTVGVVATTYWGNAQAVASSVETMVNVEIVDFNHATRRPKMTGSSGQVGVSSTPRIWVGSRAAGAHNALRINTTSGTANITSALVRLYGKR